MFEVEVHRPAVSEQVATIRNAVTELAAQLGGLTLQGAWSGPLSDPARHDLAEVQAAAAELVTDTQALCRLAGAENALFHNVRAAVAHAHMAASAVAWVGAGVARP